MMQAILFLAAALVFVPLAVRLGLGSVLGYLLAGVAIGPVGLGLVNDPQALLHVSELGVVLMLFVIGLELEPKRLWEMRGAVFGGGTLQMLACAAAIFPVGLLLGWTWQASLMGALALALSSTAIVVALLQERNLMAVPVGRSGFSMLLYQDIAAIPLLALAAVLGTTAPAAESAAHAHQGPIWQVAAVAAVVVLGRYVAYPAMRFVARMQVRELFTGFALLLVLGVAALMEHVGLSMGLGAFLAGVLLASSEYRHALETDILPFKGLLLGLFFIAVGMSMDLGLLASSPVMVLLGLVTVVGSKLVALWSLAPWVGLRGSDKALLAVLLSQVGEFAFVVLAAAKLSGVLPEAQANLLTLIAALSMVSTPLLLTVFDRWYRQSAQEREADAIEDEHPAIIVAGFGRYGQTVCRLLLATGVKPTVIDHDADTVDSARRFGYKVYFGDATHPDLLQAAGIRYAKAVVVAVDDSAQCNRLVEVLQHDFAHVQIVARARDAMHAMELAARKVHYVEREVFESSLRSGRSVLELLGVDRDQAKQMADNFRRYSLAILQNAQAERHNEEGLIMRVRQAREQFEREMQADQERQTRHDGKAGWHAPE
jgi:glutathione-regulated potassium-efflux system ancillary protein KefC